MISEKQMTRIAITSKLKERIIRGTTKYCDSEERTLMVSRTKVWGTKRVVL